MRLKRHSIVFALLILVAALTLTALRRARRAGTPITASEPATTTNALPRGVILLDVADARDVRAPFALREEATAAGNVALVLPRGAGSDKRKGRATLALNAPEAGTYYGWVHARWRDSCGNSLGLQLGTSPEQLAGQDQVYGTWHWVRAGQYELTARRHLVTIREREDGVAVDRLLFTRDKGFRPAGTIGLVGGGLEVRRLADDFARSPGHGMEDWDLASGKWEIRFSFDPNRIPYQYGLVGEATKDKAVALAKGTTWKGCRLAFSMLPLTDGTFGAVLDRSDDGAQALFVSLRLAEGQASLKVVGAGLDATADIGESVRLGQWHRIVIERWAWVVRVMVDGRTVLERFDATPGAGQIGLVVAKGKAVFDDFTAEQIPWQAEDGREFKIPWIVGRDAAWHRPPGGGAREALIGERGAITARWGKLPVREIVLWDAPGSAGLCAVECPGLEGRRPTAQIRVFQPARSSNGAPSAASFAVTNGPVRISRVAIRYGELRPDNYSIGPYHFTDRRIEDPSDYLDFTPEEYKLIQQSPDSDKLRRRPNYKPLLGKSGGYSPWIIHSGSWRVGGGVLTGTGPGAVLRHSQEIVGDLELRLKLRMIQATSVAGIRLAGGSEPGAYVRVTTAKPGPADAAGQMRLHAGADGKWHDLLIRVSGDTVTAQLDKQAPQKGSIARNVGGITFLTVPTGGVAFDDIEFVVPRGSPDGFLYPFDRREPDWWREGNRWMDHGGIACVMASNWISLIAPDGRGMLWNKRSFGPDVLLAANIEENTEWFGWKKRPNHVHYPYDNICLALSPEQDSERGYRLEVNSQNRSATVLYRNGKEVARVAQDDTFPIQYVGEHNAYVPRKNRVCLVKRGGLLRAIVNDQCVLEFDDPEPIDVSRAGIGGYKTRINFSHIQVRRLPATSTKADPNDPEAKP